MCTQLYQSINSLSLSINYCIKKNNSEKREKMKFIINCITPLLIIISLAAQANSQFINCILYFVPCRNLCSTVNYSTSNYCTITRYWFFFFPCTTRCQCSLYGTGTTSSTSTSTSTSTSSNSFRNLAKREAPTPSLVASDTVETISPEVQFNNTDLAFNKKTKTALILLVNSVNNEDIQLPVYIVVPDTTDFNKLYDAKKSTDNIKQDVGFNLSDTLKTAQNRIVALNNIKIGQSKISFSFTTPITSTDTYTDISTDTSTSSSTDTISMDSYTSASTDTSSTDTLTDTSTSTSTDTSTSTSTDTIVSASTDSSFLTSSDTSTDTSTDTFTDTSTSTSIDILTSTSVRSEVILDGLIGYWGFNGNTLDLVTGLSISGSFEYVNDRNGHENSAINFNTNYAIIPNCANNNVSSVSLWIFMTQILYGSQTIFDINGWSLRIVNGQFQYGDSTLNYQIKSYPIQKLNILTKNMLVNRWIHVATTIDGGIANLYMDGDLFWTDVYSLALADVNECTLGSFASLLPLNALLDDVFFYNRALSGDEILRIMEIVT